MISELHAEYDRLEALAAPWKLLDYTGDACPKCSRIRLCKCPNGKTRCEKCNWIVEDSEYCSYDGLY